jgi:tripartite-type tricarboxylate transporter receptor subunit TctC
MFAPAGTPPEVIAKLNEAAVAAVQDPGVQARLKDMGASVVGLTPEQLAEHVKTEMAKWAPVVKASGAQID